MAGGEILFWLLVAIYGPLALYPIFGVPFMIGLAICQAVRWLLGYRPEYVEGEF